MNPFGARRRPLVAGLSAAALTLALMACGSSGSDGGTGKAGSSGSVPGVTPTSVTVGGHFPLTGPAAPGYSEIPAAVEAYFKYVNAHGGVYGRKLHLIARDDAYNPAKTVQVTKQLVLQDHIFAMLDGLGTPTHSKVVDFLNAEHVPDLFVASGCLCWNEPRQHPYTFGWQTDYYREGKILGRFVAQRYKGRKIGYLLQHDDFGADGERGLDRYIPKSAVVDRETYEPTNTDIGPQMAKLKASGAQVVVAFTVPAFTALAELAFVKLNWHPQLVVSSVGIDPTTLAGLLKSFSKGEQGASLIEGVRSDFYMPPVGAKSNPWVKLFERVRDEYLPKTPFDGNVAYGLATAYTFVHALERAGRNPTRESIVKAVEAGGMRGPGFTPFAFSKTDHAGLTGVRLGVVRGGRLVLHGPPLVTDGGDGPVRAYRGRQARPPANGIPPAS